MSGPYALRVPRPWDRPGLLPWRYRVVAVMVAGLFGAFARAVAVPMHWSASSVLDCVAVNALFLLSVPALAGFEPVLAVAAGVTAGLLPRLWPGWGAAAGTIGLGVAAGVFAGPRGLGCTLDELRRSLARRGPPEGGGGHAI